MHFSCLRTDVPMGRLRSSCWGEEVVTYYMPIVPNVSLYINEIGAMVCGEIFASKRHGCRTDCSFFSLNMLLAAIGNTHLASTVVV